MFKSIQEMISATIIRSVAVLYAIPQHDTIITNTTK